MKAPAPHPALPKITVTKEGRHWRVDWDYQEAPESRVLSEKSEFLDGYVCGIVATLGVSAGEICRPSARVGTVKKMDEETALKLAKLLKDLLHPVVEDRHRRLVYEANLPHVKFLAEKQEVKTSVAQ
ncbi:hypothetical protein PUP68_07655 [Pseudomonas chlororaphis]|uniref:hypothetical protein n=1 Tax=Pseudomonas chlororaphis TaxID=587753 RepID=UPI002368E830|nr:hypothetical protein [Pseudomonas chlororaphis]WDG79976.1 hypothetical protein PUP77_04585 [Pseudomonas chlororaphis]WDG86971.1 hypothetical protein PUP68_07655 [Pseudomonas chlororaphis]